MSIEILPCPFCGHTDVEICEIQPGTIAIDCPECECIGPFAESVELAAAKWNLAHGNDRVEGRDAASSRRVPSHDGLGDGDAK